MAVIIPKKVIVISQPSIIRPTLLCSG